MPTSMIGLCQEGKSSPDALRRSAGVSLSGFFAACVGLAAVVPISDRTRLPFAVSDQRVVLNRRLSLCFLPVSKLISGGIQSLRSFAQSALRQDLAGYASKKSSLFTATLYAAMPFACSA